MKEEQRVYIKGSASRGDEVIKILKDLGGKNTHSYAGDGFDSYYFIDPCGVILVSDFNSEVFSFVKEFYKEINLPKWKPKYEETYYRINWRGAVVETTWYDTQDEESCYEFGNCFRTKEEAEATRDKIKELLNNRA